MKPKKRKTSRFDFSMKLNIFIVVLFSVLIVWGIFLVRDRLLANADELGTSLAESYASEEENRIAIYQMLLNLASTSINNTLEKGGSSQQVQEWLTDYSSHLTHILGSSVIDPYAVIDGTIIAATPWEGDQNYDYQSTEWYQKALSQNGDVSFTNAYLDTVTGKYLITLAKKLNGSGNVLAFDILLENFHLHENKASLPQNSSYFLYDGNGNLIYLSGSLDIKDPDVRQYAENLLTRIQDGSLQSYSAAIRDLEGKNRSVYYHIMENGWISVITMPVQSLLTDNMDTTFLLLFGICAALLLTACGIILRFWVGSRKMQHVQDTLQILGDTYYAIYRIDYEKATYESIKSSDDVSSLLGSGGSYQHLIDVVKEYVDQRTYTEFEQSFSLENIKKLIQDQIYEFGGDYQRRFGEDYKWVSIKIIYNKSMKLNHVIMCFREIDAEKRRQLKQHILLENALKSARQTAEKKNAFFSHVSHDMRTPLNAIIGLSKLMKDQLDHPEKIRDYTAKIEQAGTQLLTLVNDILDMSRLEKGTGSTLDYTVMNLETFLQESVSLFKDQALTEQKELTVSVHLQHPAVYCDPFRLSQVINNLLSNALKYSMSGARITVNLAETGVQSNRSRYQLTVSDTGIGMSREFMEHIFEPFSRETLFAPSKISGTGLGMPIVKSLVQQMSGEITVESTLGEGSTFTIILPLQIAESEALPPSPKKEPAVNPQGLQNKKILIAEDNEINMEIASECLCALGAQVISAWNGREAVEIFSAAAPGSIDAILMDMQMPEMDGCAASQAIRSLDRPDAKTVPIIAVTANAFAEDIARTKAAGMNDHLSKPIDFKLMEEVLSKALH